MIAEVATRCWPASLGHERTLRSVLFNHLESDSSDGVVMVSSSIFANVIDEALGGVSNLGFDGANALTGLRIIQENGNVPRVIFVEMGLNSLAQSRGVHQGIFEMFEERNWMLFRRSLLHASRRENNLHSRLRTLVRDLSTDKKVRGITKVNSAFYDRALAQYLHRQKQRDQAGYFHRKDLERWLQEQKKLIDDFISQGVKVVLVRPPEAESMREARAGEYEIEKQFFPATKYDWLDPMMDQGPFLTSDGIHLLRDDSIRLLKVMLGSMDH